MLRLETHASIKGLQAAATLKVVAEPDTGRARYSPRDCAFMVSSAAEAAGTERAPWGAVLWKGGEAVPPLEAPVIFGLREPAVVAAGDVIRVVPGSTAIRVLYRRGANSNVLFTTERCNSHCIMCSQPPRNVDDEWRVAELFKLIALIDESEPQLAITGGEPTLLGHRLADLIQYCSEMLPLTALHVLSNGRLLATGAAACSLCRVQHQQLSWGIPLYSDVPEVHDYVVQAKGAFRETVDGLYNLAEHGQRIEIRVVLGRPSVERLEQLAYFIFRNMPFVEHVAFMGVEPIGFAPVNRHKLQMPFSELAGRLENAVHYLADRGVPVSIYNLPLCLVPRSLWSYYRRSISDWKNVYVKQCDDCAARPQCGGFFGSVRPAWVPKELRPFSRREVEAF